MTSSLSDDAAANSISQDARLERIRQFIKWTVYSLLILNWFYYIHDDWQSVRFTVLVGDPLEDWMNAYATSIDELGWFTLLFLFELETYWLSDEAMTKIRRSAFVLIRFACYAFLAHTVYAYIFNLYELHQAVTLSAVENACDLAGQGYSFLRNDDYRLIELANCSAISDGVAFYQIGGDPVITDASGLAEMKFLYAIDIQDAVVWLAVVLLIELVVLLQERGIGEGPLIATANWITVGLYAVLVAHALIWAWKGHWVWAWDELLWIGGFAAIEMNLSEWRKEMHEDAATA